MGCLAEVLACLDDEDHAEVRAKLCGFVADMLERRLATPNEKMVEVQVKDQSCILPKTMVLNNFANAHSNSPAMVRMHQPYRGGVIENEAAPSCSRQRFVQSPSVFQREDEYNPIRVTQTGPFEARVCRNITNFQNTNVFGRAQLFPPHVLRPVAAGSLRGNHGNGPTRLDPRQEHRPIHAYPHGLYNHAHLRDLSK